MKGHALENLLLLLFVSLVLTDIAKASTFEVLYQSPIPTSGPFRVLVVFVRFQDDSQPDLQQCTLASQEWAQPDVVPPFSQGLLASHPNPPFPESSLTDYFYRQSQGRFTLYGDVYPQVLVTEKPEAAYGASNKTTLNRHILSQEILHRLNADPALDLSAYDANADQLLDHVFIILRKLNKLVFVGGENAAGISNLGYSSKVREFGRDPHALKMVSSNISGSYLHYMNAGNIVPSVNIARLMAHEFGHALWTPAMLKSRNEGSHGMWHIKPIGNLVTGVPADDPLQIGYVLMAGLGSGKDCRGDMTISAYERDLLQNGWITCQVLQTDGAYTITDLYSDNTANCYQVVLPSASGATRTVYLSNRQRVGFFDRLRTVEALYTKGCNVPLNHQGLKTTGLLATANERDGFAVIAADNTLKLSPDATAYQGDLFGPETATQLTPWTRPNLTGYTQYPDAFQPQDATFQAIDNIRYAGGPDGEMVFDYIEDFRTSPVIRENSWMGEETKGHMFTGDFVVTDSSELKISTALSFSGTVRIEGGSSVVLEAAGTFALLQDGSLRIEEGSSLEVEGALILEGDCDHESMARINGRTTNTQRNAAQETPAQFELAQNYPNPFNPTTTISYTLPQPSDVTLTVYDVLGRQVRALASGLQFAGTYEVSFDATGLASGLYVYCLQAGDYVDTKRMMVMR